MEEFYQQITLKIQESGYPHPVDGKEIYDEICDQMEDKEPGSYLFMSKKEDDVFFEYKIEIFEEQFNLYFVRIHTKEREYFVDFDS